MSQGSLLYLIIAEQGIEHDDTILEALNRENTFLQSTLNDFTALCKHVTLFCFFEQRKTNIGRIVRRDLPTVSHELLHIWKHLLIFARNF